MIAAASIVVVVLVVTLTVLARWRSPSVPVADAQARAEAEIWFHKTWRRVEGAVIRGQVKRDGLRVRRELRDEMRDQD
jgi:hypothetical protein